MSAAENEQIFMTTLVRRTQVAERTMAFEFKKPEHWKFRAGQFIEATLIDPPETDAEGNSRSFSIASAPAEPTIMVATRIRDSAFKKVLREMPLNSPVRMEGPFGNFVLHNNASRPAVFISGGIGITPVRSIIVNAAREKLPHRIYLFYANRRPQDAPFLDEITSLTRNNAKFTFVPIMTEAAQADQPWQGEKGRINKDLMQKYLSDKESPVYYLCGPPGMVSGLQQALHETGVDDDDIRSEEFPGY